MSDSNGKLGQDTQEWCETAMNEFLQFLANLFGQSYDSDEECFRDTEGQMSPIYVVFNNCFNNYGAPGQTAPDPTICDNPVDRAAIEAANNFARIGTALGGRFNQETKERSFMDFKNIKFTEWAMIRKNCNKEKLDFMDKDTLENLKAEYKHDKDILAKGDEGSDRLNTQLAKEYNKRLGFLAEKSLKVQVYAMVKTRWEATRGKLTPERAEQLKMKCEQFVEHAREQAKEQEKANKNKDKKKTDHDAR